MDLDDGATDSDGVNATVPSSPPFSQRDVPPAHKELSRCVRGFADTSGYRARFLGRHITGAIEEVNELLGEDIMRFRRITEERQKAKAMLQECAFERPQKLDVGGCEGAQCKGLKENIFFIDCCHLSSLYFRNFI